MNARSPPSSDTQASASRWIPYLVAGAFFMENLDATVIATALPAMGDTFGVAPARLSVGISAYMLALAVFIPISGWLADRFGPRSIFASAIAVFTLASVACGLSQSLGQFTAARVLQGIGGAMMVPVGRLVVLRGTSKKDLVRAIATITWPGLAAPVIGPPVGGFITAWVGWHWIFLLNVPLGLIAWAVALKLIGNQRETPRPFDLLGFVLSGASFSAFMLGLEFAGQSRDRLPLAAALVVGSIVGLVLTVRHFRRVAHPLIDLSALGNVPFSVNLVGGSFFRTAIGGTPFLLPLMFQLVFGWSEVDAGLLLLGMFGGTLVMKPATTAVMKRFGLRRVSLVTGTAVAVGTLGLGFLDGGMPWAVLGVLLFVVGATRSMQFTAYNTLAFAELAPAQMNGASTLFSVSQQLNAAMGIAFAALALEAAQWATGGSAPSLLDFRIGFAALAVLALLGALDCRRLERDAGAAVSGHGAGSR